jgi:glycolate oxidase FAD binding subunit
VTTVDSSGTRAPANDWAHRPTEVALAAQVAVHRARAAGGGLRIAGAGCWLDAGRPVHATQRFSLAPYAGIVDYVPGDLTLTALAGTTLGEIRRATAAERQWLALDPAGGDAGTIGATIATASAGPLSHAFGTPRDATLGLEFVTGAGDVARGGGRVVKNVAGFDLVRLMTGAWGTLGIVTEVTVRLRARPAVEETVAVALPDAGPALAPCLAALRAAPLVALALELLSPALSASLGMERRPLLLARLGGNEALVRAQRATLATLGDAAPAPDDVWDRLATAEPVGGAVCRFSALPSRLADTWTLASAAAEGADGFAHATVGRGIARVALPATADARALALPNFTGRRVYERLPAALWATLAPSAVADDLSQRIARAFDPDGALNPGVLGPRLPDPSR